jgi:hypothetical protein
MIQRIQTVYLLIAEILTGILFFVPFGNIAVKTGSIYRCDIKGVYLEGVPKPEAIFSSLPVDILWAVSLIFILVTIFSFKKRVLQMKLAKINIFLMLGLGGLIFYYVWSIAKQLSGAYSFTIFLVFPVISAILIYLAFRAIDKDEKLVRSIDRIR